MTPKQDCVLDSEPPSAKNVTYSLSRYYPKETIYFYGFPAGENSNFFNMVPPWKEELVAARPLTCAGDALHVVTFATSIDPEIRQIMTESIGVRLIDKSKILAFPEKVNSSLHEHERNEAIRGALLSMITTNNKFVMAQPYMNGGLNQRYLIPSEVAIALNDKINRYLYTPEKYLPERYQLFQNGQEFAEDTTTPPIPCVVKVSSSSSGDGVRICFTKADFEQTKKDFALIKVKIMTEKYIESIYNLGIQFGISHDGTKIEIIGHNEQFIDESGSYMGGVIDPYKKISILPKISQFLKTEILPKIQKLNWFGVGGIDILVDKNEDFFVIDPNLRMTAATSYLFFAKNGELKKPLISFMGEFQGSKEDFLRKIVPLAKENTPNQMLKVVALTKRPQSYGINAGIFFDDCEDLVKKALQLKALGMVGKSLDRIITSKHTLEG